MSGTVSTPLNGLVAVVTGGASGLGAAIVQRLQSDGARVAAFDLHEAPAADLSVTGDIRDDASVRAGIARVVDELGRLDIVVNNAGIGLVKQIPDVTEEEWDRVLDINFKSVYLTARHAIPHLKKAGGGSIVNISTNAGLLPRAHDPV